MNSKRCRTVEHGIIFNIHQLQIFRKHGNLIFPITRVIDFPDFNDQSQRVAKDVKKIISYLKNEIIEKPRNNKRLPGTIITIWNNKGGVGKTTTASYLSLLLSIKDRPFGITRRNRVIAIDYDHNQANLTKRFERERTHGKTERLLSRMQEDFGTFNQYELKAYIETIKARGVKCKGQGTTIDFLPADQSLCDYEAKESSGQQYKYQVQFYNEENCLRKLCLELAKEYDYIIIDAPPGLEQNIYARAAVEAADCLLPIGSYGDFDSFHGYYSIVCDKLPEIHEKVANPDDLGLWINNWSSNKQHKVINKMMLEEFNHYIKVSNKKQIQENLKRGFFESFAKNKLRSIKYSVLILKASCHNPNTKEDLLQTFNHDDIIKAYSDLLRSVIGEGS